ncbi:DUF3108 domain-containing protein [Rhodoferax sp.]|uniref:DUF3108 domain-containing protein n=1 Tax=Rhodoferax sp. TaxID=50421 RepID=UPI0025D58BB5|nr:DUF3108 domain-containing protein [Rhodoferax sp.]MCM2295983.1 DUF3108 domain-containing protein [Rhodoferax sp.]MDD3936626.1 DUF3108 domain-containing protein [Rhodoferax sp.]
MTLKTWFSLGLLVLLVHLVLLQKIPLHVPALPQEGSSSFATRTVVLATSSKPAPSKTVAIEGKPARRTAPKPKPVRQPVTAPAPSVPADISSAMAAADTTDTDVNPVVEPTAEPIASPASAPASVPIPATEQPLVSAEPAPVMEAGPVLPVQEVAFRADGLPGSVKLVYRVDANKFPYTLRSELTWQHDESSYQAHLSINALGQSRVQTSRGTIDQLGLAPERFSDKYRSELAAHFNRAQGLVSFSANTPSIPLQPGAQDRLSVLAQLAALVASAPQGFSPGTTLQVQTIGPRSADLWLFTFGNMETLELPGGTQQGLKLVRQPRQMYDQKLEVWLAPGLAYLPARIRITEANGDYVDQKWEATAATVSP